MPLDRYRKKRDFRATPEPAGRVGRHKAGELSFVVQKHAASHLHYDFRLELDGVLLSWAVPKGPSLDPQDKRLAIAVEDHPLEYGAFEGIIPPRQYGAGTVIVWDRGRWIPRDDPREGLRKGKLKFFLQGEKLHGGWTLVKSHGSKYAGGNGESKAWLLIKENDGESRSGSEAQIVERAPESVLSQRSLDDVARAKSRVWESTKSADANVKAGAVKPLRSAGGTKSATGAAPRASRAALPATLSPQLATLVDRAPEGPGWLHEIKYDGYRMLGRIQRGRCRIWSRNGKEWTGTLAGLAKAAAGLPVKNAWIDGEVVVRSADGGTSFQALQNALGGTDETSMVWFVFDLPFLDGHDLRATPLVERKRLLEPLLAGAERLQFGNHFVTDGPAMLREACELGFEGIVSKRAEAPYVSTRARTWLKVKCSKRQEFVIGGFTEGQGSRKGFGALLLGVYEGAKLRYAGKVGTGFDEKALENIRDALDKLATDVPPFVNPPRGAEGRRATWVKPALVGEVSFTEWTREGTLRHPAFEGLRLDKKPREVVREKAAPAPARKDSAATGKPVKSTSKRSSGDRIAGVAISNPDKPFFPEIGLTKGELCAWFDEIAPLLLPHVRNRPLSLLRCPNGWEGKCFYQKHANDTVPEWVDRVEVHDSGGPAQYMMANSVKSLVTLAQLGVIEVHPWGSKAGKLDKPDRLIFDLDPDDDVPWDALKSAALLTRTLLSDLGLESFLKTTGGKGLHVVVPTAATMEWEMAKTFVRDASNVLVHTFPDRFTTNLSKSARKGRIFIDYLRNAHGATAIAPYSVRARKNAPIAVPVEWEALDDDIRFDFFNVRSGRSLLDRPDPWNAMAKLRQSVTAAMRKRVATLGVKA